MEIYLAGGYSGNLQPYWNRFICRERERERKSNSLINKEMRIYIAGEHSAKTGTDIQSWQGLNILESYYYLQKNTHFERLIKTVPMGFLLDSGAFTMKANANVKLDWKKYVEEYADFINKYHIEKFIELDIEEIIGMQKYEYLRDMLIERTGKQPVVVWHSCRGYDYWKKMLTQFPYVAIATTLIKNEGKIWRKHPSMISRFIGEAHAAGCKIHGLGYTNCTTLRNLRFDSVDSTAWLYGNRAGYLYMFNPSLPAFFEKIKAPAGKGRLKSKESALHNFREWTKFSAWAEKNL